MHQRELHKNASARISERSQFMNLIMKINIFLSITYIPGCDQNFGGATGNFYREGPPTEN